RRTLCSSSFPHSSSQKSISSSDGKVGTESPPSRETLRLPNRNVEGSTPRMFGKREARMLHGFFQDLRYGIRALYRRPSGPIVLAVAAMAIGIGAAVAIFSVVNAVLLRPLPYPAADRVVAVWNQFTRLGLPEMSLSE